MPGENCPDCAPYSNDHLQNWVKELVEFSFHRPFERFFRGSNLRTDELIDNLLIKIGVFNLDKKLDLEKLPVTASFINSAAAAGIDFQAIKSPRGHTGYFRMKIGEKYSDFEKLPRAEHAVKNKLADKVDDKWFVKQNLAQNGLPVAPGRAFWWFQKNKARDYGRILGYPLIVKPRCGSLSKHVYYNIANEPQLEEALKNVTKSSPVFIIEKFLPNLTLYRITVVDGDKMFVAKRLPPRIKGDGKQKIRALLEKSEIGEDKVNLATLARQGFTLDSVPKKGAAVELHHKITLALGAKFEEVKNKDIQKDNIEMFKKIAGIFGNKLLGVDFLCEDIKKSWRGQRCAVLELNSLPNILMHDFGQKDGSIKNKVTEALVDLTRKYYS